MTCPEELIRVYTNGQRLSGRVDNEAGYQVIAECSGSEGAPFYVNLYFRLLTSSVIV